MVTQMVVRQLMPSSTPEICAAVESAMRSDIRVSALSAEDLLYGQIPADQRQLLTAGEATPVGSVEFLRSLMKRLGVAEPAPMDYPPELHDFLHREVRKKAAGLCGLEPEFIKPISTKTFTGFVFNVMDSEPTPGSPLQEDYLAFMALPAEEKVWASEVVEWASEFRYYVLRDQIVGRARYDDGADSAPEPSEEVAMACIDRLRPLGLAAYALDLGTFPDGQTALIEVNDAWALGFYRGGISTNDYLSMLAARWRQIASPSK